MRPRVFPAEDLTYPPGKFYQEASMRPRVFPAEDSRAQAGEHIPFIASMRPRVFPAEDFYPEDSSDWQAVLQ